MAGAPFPENDGPFGVTKCHPIVFPGHGCDAGQVLRWRQSGAVLDDATLHRQVVHVAVRIGKYEEFFDAVVVEIRSILSRVNWQHFLIVRIGVTLKGHVIFWSQLGLPLG